MAKMKNTLPELQDDGFVDYLSERDEDNYLEDMEWLSEVVWSELQEELS